MTDSETLLVVLVVVYLVECLFWVRPGALVFRTLWKRHWRLVKPTDFLTNDRGQLCWSNPCPPFGGVHVTRTFPFCVSPEGVRIGGIEVTATAGPVAGVAGRFYPFATLQSIEADEKKLLLNKTLIWRSDSVHQPAALATLLRDLKRRDPAARAARIRQELAARLDVSRIVSQRKEFAQRTSSLQLLTLGLFGALFVLCPLAVWLVGFRPTLVPMLAGLFALTIAITVLFRRRHKHFYPEANDDRFKLSMLTSLVPAVSIRARDLLGRPLLEAFHPLAVARELLPAADFAHFARRCWRELNYPMLRPNEAIHPEGNETEVWFRAELLKAYETFLSQAGVSERLWLEHPPVSDPTHSLFCPRCETQFTAQARACATCGGRALEKLGCV